MSWGAGVLAAGAACLAGVGLLFLVIVAAAGSAFEVRGGFRSGAPSAAAAEIPGDLFPVLYRAERTYGVSWAVLAAIAKIESGFGRGEEYLKKGGVSDAGAVGFMQFMPTTWSGSGNPLACDDPKSPSWDTDPERIARFGGYGVDGDGDGTADPYNPWDAVLAAAKYLAANGFADDPRRALYRYNHSWSYVDGVLELAERYAGQMVPVADGVWPLPPAYAKITSGFGPRELEGRVEPHYGIDIACPEGTPVFAVLPGRVEAAGWGYGYGYFVRLRHEDNVVTLYAHLSEVKVERGDWVDQGQEIALSGSTGRSTGPHLHFEVHVNGRPCDPEAWLRTPSENY